jgi:hypothetical protein
MSGGRSAPSALPGVPLVSIVTPCLNPGERLLRCIESVSAQGHGAIEHVVVDGGSTDGTIERLESDMRIRWLSEPDRGQAHAINKGFALATGSLLTWLNADDVLLPGAIEEVVSAVAADRRLGLVYGHCRIVEGGHEVLTWRAPRRLTQRGLEAGASIPQPGAFVSRWALEWIGGLDESFELAMDVDLWLRLLAAGVPNRGLGTIVSEFELHPGSKTVSIPRERFFAENARAFLLAGNSRGAALSAGQGAAAAATVDGHVDRARLRTQIGTAVEAAAGWPGSAPLRTIGAAARAEAAMIELRASPLALRHLLAVDIWRDRAIRRRVLAGMRRGAPRIARTLVRRPA